MAKCRRFENRRRQSGEVSFSGCRAVLGPIGNGALARRIARAATWLKMPSPLFDVEGLSPGIDFLVQVHAIRALVVSITLESDGRRMNLGGGTPGRVTGKPSVSCRIACPLADMSQRRTLWLRWVGELGSDYKGQSPQCRFLIDEADQRAIDQARLSGRSASVPMRASPRSNCLIHAGGPFKRDVIGLSRQRRLFRFAQSTIRPCTV